jgi:hypothetical protein
MGWRWDEDETYGVGDGMGVKRGDRLEGVVIDCVYTLWIGFGGFDM